MSGDRPVQPENARRLPTGRRRRRIGAGCLLAAAASSRSERCAQVAARLAAAHHGVALAEIAAPTRRSVSVARARQTAMYLTHTLFEVPLTAVAAAFGRDRATVAYACRLIEDKRDDAGFDAAMAQLEPNARVLLEWEERLAE